jgi:hypothetical protein
VGTNCKVAIIHEGDVNKTQKKDTIKEYDWTSRTSNTWLKAHVLLSAKATAKLTKQNSVALVRERTIPTERPLHVGEDSASF